MILANYFQESTKVERILGVISIILMLIFYWTSGYESDPGEYVYKSKWLLMITYLFFIGSLFLYNILLIVGKKITVIGIASLVSFIILILMVFLLGDLIAPCERPFINEAIALSSFISVITINLITVFAGMNDIHIEH